MYDSIPNTMHSSCIFGQLYLVIAALWVGLSCILLLCSMALPRFLRAVPPSIGIYIVRLASYQPVLMDQMNTSMKDGVIPRNLSSEDIALSHPHWRRELEVLRADSNQG